MQKNNSLNKKKSSAGKKDVTQLIKDCGLPIHEAEFLLMELLAVDRKDLYTAEVSQEVVSSFMALVERRKQQFPIQYLVGVSYFYGYRFKVVPGVFIPRPETEILVEEVLNFLGKGGKRRKEVNILDVGCGCGNISLSIACEDEKVDVDGLDISSLAIMISTENKKDMWQLSCLKGKVRFILGDFMEISSHPQMEERYDIIVSNPPYLDFGQYQELPDDVKKEPPLALFSSDGGNFFYSVLFSKGRNLLKENGMIFIELPGDDNRTPVICDLAENFGWKLELICQDLNGRDRVLIARR